MVQQIVACTFAAEAARRNVAHGPAFLNLEGAAQGSRAGGLLRRKLGKRIPDAAGEQDIQEKVQID